MKGFEKSKRDKTRFQIGNEKVSRDWKRKGVDKEGGGSERVGREKNGVDKLDMFRENQNCCEKILKRSRADKIRYGIRDDQA